MSHYSALNIVVNVAKSCMPLILSCKEFYTALDDPWVLAWNVYSVYKCKAYDRILGIEKYEKISEKKRMQTMDHLLTIFTEIEKIDTKENILFGCCVQFSPNVDIARAVLNRGVDIHFDDDACLQYACNHSTDGAQLVKMLLDHGADLHVDDDMPLVKATKAGNIDIVTHLLDRGACANASDEYILNI